MARLSDPWRPGHDGLRRWAARTERAPAAVSDGRVLTYGELDAQAQRLAWHLHMLGVRKGDRVALHLRRSVDLVLAIHATLRAGAAYVPLDPALPPRRIAEVLDEVAPTALLANRPLDPTVKVTCPIVKVEDAADAQATSLPTLSPEDIAYVLYTSGSTGRPKGVMVPHGALRSHLDAMTLARPLRAGVDRLLFKTAVTFDTSIWELFWTFDAGATMVVATDGRQLDMPYLADLIDAERVTVVQFTPTTLAAFLDATETRRLESLRLVMSIGEALPPALVARHLKSRACPLWNLYGPTEATVAVTEWTCGTEDVERGRVPIGRPLAGVRAYVLRDDLTEAPPEEDGDLYLGGVQVARGYLNRPELTAERFVADTVTGAGRMYRTGDRARARVDGALEFLGRRDGQIKLRGRRIELEGIESTLVEHPEVRQAAVAVREIEPGEPRLVAYLVHDGDAGSLTATMREFLAPRLPLYLHPAAFVSLNALPLTTSGKLNRDALPAPSEAPARSAPAEETLSPTERAVRELCVSLLGHEDFNADTNLFDVGLDSMRVTKLVSRLEEAFPIRIEMHTLVAAPTVRAVAQLCKAGPGAGGPITIMRPGGSDLSLVFVHTLAGDLFYYRHIAPAADPRATVLGVLPEDTLLDGVYPSLDALLQHYAAAIDASVPSGRIYLCGGSMGGLIALETARHLAKRGRDVGPVALVDGWPTYYTRAQRLVEYAHQFTEHRAPCYALDVLKSEWAELKWRDRWGHARGRFRGLRQRLSAPARPPPSDGAPVEHSKGHQIYLTLRRLWQEHRPTPFPGDALLFRATEQPALLLHRRMLGWDALVEGHLGVIDVAGDHLNVVRGASADRISVALNRLLNGTAVTTLESSLPPT